MAHANNNIITGRLRGLLGKQLVFREWQGKTIVAKAPKQRSGPATAAQVEIKNKFYIASRYAKSIVRNPDQSMALAYAAALRPRQNVYSRALADFMTSPVVSQIDVRNYTGAAGEKISVRATDDFRVVLVRVEIYAADGSLLESGNAVQNLFGIDWSYTSTQMNSLLTGSKIKAIAKDVPGNEGMMEVVLL